MPLPRAPTSGSRGVAQPVCGRRSTWLVVAFAGTGCAVALGVLLDTFVVRSVLVTSLFLDAGPKMRWPHRLSHRKPNAGRPGG